MILKTIRETKTPKAKIIRISVMRLNSGAAGRPQNPLVALGAREKTGEVSSKAQSKTTLDQNWKCNQIIIQKGSVIKTVLDIKGLNNHHQPPISHTCPHTQLNL